MIQRHILVLNPNPVESDYLSNLCRRFGTVITAESQETAAVRMGSFDIQAAVLDVSLASFAASGGLLKKTAGIIITGGEDAELRSRAREWPADYYVDTCIISLPVFDDLQFYRAMERALAHSQLKAELRDTRYALDLNEAKVKEVYSEIKEIKGLVNENFIKELEKRIAIEAKYVWFQKERQRIEKVLRKIYAANDASSLLDIIADIKDIVQAGGATIYVLDANDTLGKYLKPLVWDDAFLTHPEFSKFIALFDAQDFAASVARLGREINVAELTFDKRLSPRYIEHLKTPLKSIMGVPIKYDEAVIGVVEVYNKTSAGKPVPSGFTREDQEVLRGLSEHIGISMTKLNLIQYDALTGLLRPDPFFEKVIQKINSQSNRRPKEGSYALVMGDVDWFKNYNDRNGHEAGNKLLRDLAGVLKFSIRDEDLLCRYGGEEFLFFLTGVRSLEEAFLLTDRIRKNVEEHYFEHQEFQPRNNLTMSFGVAFLPKKRLYASSPITRSDLKLLAGEADMAMAEAKGKKAPEPGFGEKGERVLMKNKVCSYSREWIEEKGGGTIQTYKETSYREKRKHERFNTSTLLMVKENGGFKVAKTVNLSLGGAKILTEAKLPLAKSIDLVLILGNKASALRSNVIYSDKDFGESPYYYSGLKFYDLEPAEQRDLEEYFLTLRSKETDN